MSKKTLASHLAAVVSDSLIDRPVAHPESWRLVVYVPSSDFEEISAGEGPKCRDLTFMPECGDSPIRMGNDDLQSAVDSLLAYFCERKAAGWCDGGAPDGAVSDVLGRLLYEQLSRATKV